MHVLLGHRLRDAGIRTALRASVSPSADGTRPSRRSSLASVPSRPVEGIGRVTLVVVACALSLAALLAIRSLIAPLLLGACVAGIVRPWMARMRRLGGARRAAAALTALVALVFALPIAAATVPLMFEMRTALVALRDGRFGGLELLFEAGATPSSPRELLHMLGPRLAEAVPGLIGTTTELALGVLVFVMTVYYVLLDGRAAMEFVQRVSPLASQHVDAFVREFVEVGRAVLLSIVLTAFLEGGVAGIAYFALGLSSAAMLTVLTALAAIVPIGTVLVWGPVAAVLWSQGRTFAATVLVVTGLVVIGGIDHLARPYLGRTRRARLHPLLTLVGMFGGAASLGGFGLFAGPLVVAMCLTALRLWDREQRARAASAPRVSVLPPVAGE